MCDTLDTYWAEFDLLKPAATPKPLKKSNNYLCAKCEIPKVFGLDNLPMCTGCGVIDSYYIDDAPEWLNSVSEDGKVSDMSRCGMPTDLDLFSEKWGSGTIINTKGAKYAMRRLAMINFHNSMNHRDRSLFHAYKSIDVAAKDILNLQDNVVRAAKIFYRKFNEAKLTRGAVRTGIKANCVMFACKASKVARTTKEIADAFNIPTKDISRTTEMFKETVLGITKSTSQDDVTRSGDVIHRLLNEFNVADKRAVRMKCLKLSTRIEKCVWLMGKTPTSIAAVIILKTLGEYTTKHEVCEKCGVSLPTLNKIEAIMNKYLEGLVE